ncbi:hypothetical protein [Streptomyces atratus]|uniref:hypothetical protein n=1 Tax=Streptomyces atratus TaxID=1893 RepID=UPI0036542FD4
MTGSESARFYTGVLAAEESAVLAVMHQWWKVAMLHRAPAADQSRANAATGRSLVSVDDLLVDGVQ